MFVSFRIQSKSMPHACRMHAYVLCTWYVITNTHDGVTCICMSSLYVCTYVTKLASSSAYKCTCLRYVCICSPAKLSRMQRTATVRYISAMHLRVYRSCMHAHGWMPASMWCDIAASHLADLLSLGDGRLDLQNQLMMSYQ